MHVTKCIDDEHERQRSYVRVHGKPSVLNGQPILKALLESRGLEGEGTSWVGTSTAITQQVQD